MGGDGLWRAAAFRRVGSPNPFPCLGPLCVPASPIQTGFPCRRLHDRGRGKLGTGAIRNVQDVHCCTEHVRALLPDAKLAEKSMHHSSVSMSHVAVPLGGQGIRCPEYWQEKIRKRRNLEWQSLAQQQCAKLCPGI